MNAVGLIDQMFDGWKQYQHAVYTSWSELAKTDPRAPLNETVEKQLAISKGLVDSHLELQSRFTRIAFDGMRAAQDSMLSASEWRALSKASEESAQGLTDSYFAARGRLWSVWLSSLADMVPAAAENWRASLFAMASSWQGTVAKTLEGRIPTLEESILEETIVPESAKESRGSRKAVNQKESSARAVA